MIRLDFRFSFGISLVFMLCIAVGILPAQSFTIDQWLETVPGADQYEDVADDLRSIYDRAADSAGADELVQRFLREAAVKRVPPDNIVAVFDGYVDRLITAQRAVEQAGDAPSVREDAATLESAIVFLQTNAGGETLSRLLGYAQSARHAREVFLTLTQISGIDALSDETLLDLGRAMLESALSADSYSALASLYSEGRARQRPESQVVSAIVDALDDGGGLIQIRQALRR